MTRPRLVLLGALLWVAWHVGTLSAPQADMELAGHRHGAQPEQAAPQLNRGLQRFAVESEQFLGHSARTLETDSRQIAREFHAPEQRSSIQVPSEERISERNRIAPAESVPSSGPSLQGGLAMAWHQVEPLLMSIQPLAQAGWETVQAGWRQFNQSQLEASRPAHNLDSQAVAQPAPVPGHRNREKPNWQDEG